MNRFRRLMTVVGLLLGSAYLQVSAQGITTAALTGTITSADGETLPGATILAVHEPSGTQYGVATQPDGRFTIQGMRVGGPYKVTVSYVGFQPKTIEGFSLSLGETRTLNVKLAAKGQELQAVEISGKQGDVFNQQRTGAATNISTKELTSMPTITRSLTDFTRLTPQASTAGPGISFAGQNNRYNQFSIDGTVNNDVFGLAASGTNGGQTGIQPISLDAIAEIQVSLAPFDVRQGGFTGGSINAITRSGTNNWEGSAYLYGNNQKLVGKNPTKLADYNDYQTGFRLGGPIVKNKLFFFVNGEVTDKSSPLSYAPGTSSSHISIAQADSAATVAKRLGYDPGAYSNLSNYTSSQKFFARLDWNINKNNKLTIRHSYVFGLDVSHSSSPNTVYFGNNGIYFPSKTTSSVLELHSIFGNNFSNELRAGYTRVRDDRNPLGSPFPYVSINLGGSRSIALGSEQYSVANQLDQDIFTITDNLTWYKGAHTFTVGTHNEFYKVYNLFIRQNYGSYNYNSLADWNTVGTAGEVTPYSYNRSYSLTENPNQGADFKAFQLGIYAQDKWQAKQNLTLTFGVRVDMPKFTSQPYTNQAFNDSLSSQNVATNQLPGLQVMVAPRIGVNFRPNGSENTQIRGGVGIFTGRVPFVWISNQYTNTGNILGSVSLRGSSVPSDFTFEPNAFNQPTATTLDMQNPKSEIDVTDKNFKFPQVFRADAAVDQKLPGGITGTLEFMYTKTLHNIAYKNLNISQNGTLDGVDNRPYFNGIGSTDPKPYPEFSNILLLTNTNKGSSYNISATLRKSFDNGLHIQASYTYGHAKDLNGGTSSQAISNWRYVENVNGPNNPDLSNAYYDVRSRVVGSLGYTLKYKNGNSTEVNVFFNGQSGLPFSYLVGNKDLNNDGTTGNDLMYIPKSEGELTFDGDAAQQHAQWVSLDNYIKSDKYLSKHRGEYAERNGARMPWTNEIDVRLVHTFKLNVVNGTSKHNLQISLDIFNFANLINKDWGRQYDMSNQDFSLLDFTNHFVPGTRTPIYHYDPSFSNGKPYYVNDFYSRWRAQLGIRYTFE